MIYQPLEPLPSNDQEKINTSKRPKGKQFKNIDSAEYKQIVLGLILLKYITDVLKK